MHAWAPDGPTDPKWFRAYDLRALYVTEMLQNERNPNTHSNPHATARHYDRRRAIKVAPLDLR